MSTYDQGSTVRCELDVSSGSVPFDPAVLKFVCQKPDGTSIRYHYPTDPQMFRVSAGVYTVDVLADQAGVYYYRFYSEGDGAESMQANFLVNEDLLT